MSKLLVLVVALVFYTTFEFHFACLLSVKFAGRPRGINYHYFMSSVMSKSLIEGFTVADVILEVGQTRQDVQ